MVRKTMCFAVATILAAPAWATTWIVDAAGGAGSNFTTISAAVAVAGTGDVIRVRPGVYGGFNLSSGVLVLGDSSVQVTGPISITNVLPGPRATIGRMTTRAILVSNCSAAVTIEDVVARAQGNEVAALGANAGLVVLDSADVRLRNVDVLITGTLGAAEDGLYVDSSRLEVTHSRIEGAQGLSYPPQVSNGGDGMTVAGTSDVHVSLSDVSGGEGGDFDSKFQGNAGDGGHGIHVLSAQANLVVTGLPTFQIRGARGGVTNLPTCDHDGRPGSGIVLGGATARLSGATITGASYECAIPASPPAIVGVYTSPTSADPSLQVSGTIAAGQHVTYTLHGVPGSAARLRLGRSAVVQDLPNVVEDRLTVPLRTYDLGTLPASGTAAFNLLLPASLPLGYVLVAQAATTYPSNEVELSQSVTITLH